jgi:cell fate (sporulation/competence/biofilm development) regulator YmcA (YheA/YmcA/DUF963 family)
MDCCSSPKSLEIEPEIDQLATQLAVLLAQTPEYQEYIRLASLINLDPDVRRVSKEIRNREMLATYAEDIKIDDLQVELESLPAVQVYRKTQAAVKDLFNSVDQVVSTAAGVEFAPNALPSSCG